MPITQENRLLSLSTPLPYDQLLIKRMRAYEGISQLFQFELEILHEETPGESIDPFVVDPKKLIGQPMTVHAKQIAGSDEIERHFSGICIRFTQGNRNSRWTKYQAVVVPHAWLLTQRQQSRIFQQKNVPDILRVVLEGIDIKWKLQDTYEPRNYCVQYRESDWDFVSRLMEEEGIYYFFEHNENGHKMVIADRSQSHDDLPSKKVIPFAMIRSSITEDWVGSILTWQLDDRVKTGKTTFWDHNFELVGKRLEATENSQFDIGQNKKLENYDYPGEYAKYFDGVDRGGGDQASELQKIFTENKKAAKVRQQELDVAYKNSFGLSDCCSLIPGYKFEFKEHPVSAYNGKHVIVSLKTEAVQSPAYISDDDVANCYRSSFVCISHGKQDSPVFRPLRRTPKPYVHGTQTAVVVGPSGEEIFTDKYGRVKVQFHWDREGKQDEASSCWMRVAQTWAGNKWGTMFIPRIGMEVLVDFLEGDPDRPIIIGSVYNPENMPPYTLPDEKTKSTIKTNSSKGGGGFNELRFEDKKGSEQIFIHAEKDKDIRVKNDLKEIIKHDRHMIVENDQYEWVKKDKHLHVTGNQVEKVDANVHLKVGSNKEQKIGSKFAVDAGSEIHLKAGASVTIEAGAQITLKAGGSFVNISGAGVAVKGAMVMLNSGGAAGSGGGASPDTPKDPLEAVNAESGRVAKVPSKPPVTQPAKFAALAQVVRARASNPGSMSVQQAVASMASSLADAPLSAAQQLQNAAEQAMEQAHQQGQAAMAAAVAAASELKDQAEGFADQGLAAAQNALAKVEEIKDKAEAALTEAQQTAQQKLDEAKQKLADTREAAQDQVDKAKAAVNQAKEKAQAAAEDAKDQAEQAVNEAKEKLNEAQQEAKAAVDEAKQQVEEAKQEVAKAAEEAKEQAEKAVEEAKEQAEKAVEEGKQQAEAVVSEAKDQAEQAVDKATDAATDAAKQAEEAATGAAEEAKQAAEQVTEEAGKALQAAQDAIPFS